MTKNKNKKSSEAAKQEAFKLSDGICYCKTPVAKTQKERRINEKTNRMLLEFLEERKKAGVFE